MSDANTTSKTPVEPKPPLWVEREVVVAGAVLALLVISHVSGELLQQLPQPWRYITAAVCVTGFILALYFYLRRLKTKHRQQPNEIENAFQSYVHLGFAPVYASKLRGSPWEPEQCCARVQRRLFFMGVLGGKWVQQPESKQMFEAMLRRVQVAGGDVRFLLIDPKGTAYKELRDSRQGNISDSAINIWKSLVRKHSCLQVRLYNRLPTFRLSFLDDTELALSRYQLTSERHYQSKWGWEAPHVIVTNGGDWSLYPCFERYFQDLWQTATPVQ